MSKTASLLVAISLVTGISVSRAGPAGASQPRATAKVSAASMTTQATAAHRCSAGRRVCSVYRYAAYMARNAHGSRTGAPYAYSRRQLGTIRRHHLVVPSVRGYNHPRARLHRWHGHAYRGSRHSGALTVAPGALPWCQTWSASALQDSAVFGDVLFVATYRVEVCFREMTGAGGRSGQIVSAFPDVITSERHGTIYHRATTHHDTQLPAWRYRDHTTAEYESCIFRYGCWTSYYPNFAFLVGRLDRMRTGCWHGAEFRCWILDPSLRQLTMYWT